MTQPLPRQRRPYRFPSMAVQCSWCRARPGALCTNQRGTEDRRRDVHEARQTEWIRVMSTRCPESICQAAPNQPCTLHPNIHQARTLAAPHTHHHAMTRLATCHDCHHAILWTLTEAGKHLAVNPTPDPAGNAAIWRDGTGTLRSRRPTDELPLNGWERLHMPHIATCPARVQQLALPVGVTSLDEHRRKKRR